MSVMLFDTPLVNEVVLTITSVPVVPILHWIVYDPLTHRAYPAVPVATAFTDSVETRLATAPAAVLHPCVPVGNCANSVPVAAASAFAGGLPEYTNTVPLAPSPGAVPVFRTTKSSA